jgi:hypothetical protein
MGWCDCKFTCWLMCCMMAWSLTCSLVTSARKRVSIKWVEETSEYGWHSLKGHRIGRRISQASWKLNSGLIHLAGVHRLTQSRIWSLKNGRSVRSTLWLSEVFSQMCVVCASLWTLFGSNHHPYNNHDNHLSSSHTKVHSTTAKKLSEDN